MILLHFVWRKSRCSMTEEWFPVGSSLQQLIDASYSRAIFWLVTWIPQFYSFLFIEPRTGDIGIMGPYLEWLVVISSMGRSENSRPQKTWLIMCFCIIICIECPFGSIRHCKTHPYVWNGLPSPPNVPFFGDWRFICTKSPMIFPCNHVSGLNSQCLLVKSHVVLGQIHPFFRFNPAVQVATLEQSLGVTGMVGENLNRKPSIFPWRSWGFPVKNVPFKANHW